MSPDNPTNDNGHSTVSGTAPHVTLEVLAMQGEARRGNNMTTGHIGMKSWYANFPCWKPRDLLSNGISGLAVLSTGGLVLESTTSFGDYWAAIWEETT